MPLGDENVSTSALTVLYLLYICFLVDPLHSSSQENLLPTGSRCTSTSRVVDDGNCQFVVHPKHPWENHVCGACWGCHFAGSSKYKHDGVLSFDIYYYWYYFCTQVARRVLLVPMLITDDMILCLNRELLWDPLHHGWGEVRVPPARGVPVWG